MVPGYQKLYPTRAQLLTWRIAALARKPWPARVSGIEVDGACVTHIMLAPPMILEESHMLEAVDKLTTVLDNALND